MAWASVIGVVIHSPSNSRIVIMCLFLTCREVYDAFPPDKFKAQKNHGSMGQSLPPRPEQIHGHSVGQCFGLSLSSLLALSHSRPWHLAPCFIAP